MDLEPGIMDVCQLCGLSPQHGQPPHYTFWKKIRLTNIKVGEVIEKIGWKVGYKKTWSKRKCCVLCYENLCRWTNAERRITEICTQFNERTGHTLPTIQTKHARPKKVNTKKRALIQLIKQSKYPRALKALKLFKATRQAWLEDLENTVRDEMRRLQGDYSLFPSNSSEEFCWDTVLTKLQTKAPIVYSVLLAILTKNKNPSRVNWKLVKSKLGMMFLIPLHHRKPRIHQYLPHSIAAILWKCGTKGKMAAALKNLGLSKSIDAMRRYVDQPTEKNDAKLESWRNSVEAEKTQELDVQHDEKHPGYSIVVTSNRENETQVYHNCFAVKNRISFRHLDDDQSTIKAVEVPITSFLPSQEDYNELRMRMRVLVERILQANCAAFAAEYPLQHIPHRYSQECSQKSEYINMGPIQENPGTSEGMHKILNTLADVIPEGYAIPLHGDQKTVKMTNKAKVAAAVTPDPKYRLREFYPILRDFHFRAIVLKDIKAELHTPTSLTERGTLKHLGEVFGHHSVNEQASSYNPSDDFFLFIACAFVVGFATEILNEKTAKSAAEASTPSIPDLCDVADEVVRRVWFQLPMNRIADVITAPADGYDDQFCFCREETEESSMVECSNVECSNGRWFHEECVMFEGTDRENEWFCSLACEQSGKGPSCSCRTKQNGSSLPWKCANKACKRGCNFHHQCVRSTVPVAKDGDWFCSPECAGERDDERDELLHYLQRCTWYTLFSECLHDAEREGDGDATLGYWRIYLPELFCRERPKYLASAHQFLAGVSGCYPSRVAHEAIYNRTMNMNGGEGNNKAMDFQMENFKHNRKESLSNHSEEAVARAGKVARGLGQESESNSSEDDCLEAASGRAGPSRFERYKTDVRKFMVEYGDMFREQSGRKMISLSATSVGKDISQEQAAALKATLVKLSLQFDKDHEM